MSNATSRNALLAAFRFWTPGPATEIEVGPERRAVILPEIPLPVYRSTLLEGAPGPDDIGRGLYDYLRQVPDCERGREYALLLQEAFPHYLADLGAQLAMLDHKEVDPPYVRRKINGLKVLALLAPTNAGLQQQIGLAWLQLAMSFPEMAASRHHLQQAMVHLGRGERLAPQDPAIQDALGRIDYLLGDFPAARRRWGLALERLEDETAKAAVAEKLERTARLAMPERPLVEEFELVGEALELCGRGDYQQARKRLDDLEERGALPEELPAPEFFYLLGLCRERTGDPGGAFAAYDRALQLDPDYPPAREGCERIQAG